MRIAECRPRVFCGMWDAEKTCGMRYNLWNEIMRKSHLTAYKLSLASIATIYIPNTSSAVSASDIYLNILLSGKIVVCREVVFTVRRSALHGLWDRNSVRLSVRLFVRLSVTLVETRGLCPHGLTYDHDFFAIW